MSPHSLLFFLPLPPPPLSTLFPYTTLFRSLGRKPRVRPVRAQGARAGARDCAPNRGGAPPRLDRKSTRLNSSHLVISYAVFCLKKKKTADAESARQGGRERGAGRAVVTGVR